MSFVLQIFPKTVPIQSMICYKSNNDPAFALLRWSRAEAVGEAKNELIAFL